MRFKCDCVCFSKFIQDKYSGYSQKEAAYIAGAVYDSSLVLSAAVGILIVSLTTQIHRLYCISIIYCSSYTVYNTICGEYV